MRSPDNRLLLWILTKLRFSQPILLCMCLGALFMVISGPRLFIADTADIIRQESRDGLHGSEPQPESMAGRLVDDSNGMPDVNFTASGVSQGIHQLETMQKEHTGGSSAKRSEWTLVRKKLFGREPKKMGWEQGKRPGTYDSGALEGTERKVRWDNAGRDIDWEGEEGMRKKRKEEDPGQQERSGEELIEDGEPKEEADEGKTRRIPFGYDKVSWEMLTPLERRAKLAWIKGARQWAEVESSMAELTKEGNTTKSEVEIYCPSSASKRSKEIKESDGVVYLSCGLTVGSAITIIGRTCKMWDDKNKQSFFIELLGLRSNEEDPPRIYHINPRVSGDWSGKPVIEQNTQYRGQWGIAQRCEGWQSREDEVTVDGKLRCEKWSRDSVSVTNGMKSAGWLKRLMSRSGDDAVEWSFPFVDKQPFVLTIRAGWEGFHISVDGQHITSFPFRPGYIIEEATGLRIGGDLEVWQVYGTALPVTPPVSHPGLEVSELLKAPPIHSINVTMFIGILSSSSHFAERLSVRKTWMQSPPVRQGKVVVRFFVAMHGDMAVNIDVRREADAYGDMVILQYADHYDIIVLKTIAIMSYGVRNLNARYVMKCDDDTFVRLDRILQEVHNTGYETGLYMGNINEYHRPLREGKWAVTEEEWPEATYPPYADGPGYIVTRDIADFVAQQDERNQTRVYTLEPWTWCLMSAFDYLMSYARGWSYRGFDSVQQLSFQRPGQNIVDYNYKIQRLINALSIMRS